MRRLLSALCLVLPLAAASTAPAQVGGIVKKAAPKVPSVPGQQQAAAPAKPKCDNSQVVIDNDVVTRYQKSLSARDTYYQSLAKQPGSIGAYYTAVQKRKAIQQRKAAFDSRTGPDWQKQEAITKRMMNGDTTAAYDQAALSQALDMYQVQLPALEWDDQNKVQVGTDSAMMAAGKFGPCDWLDLGERVPRVVGTLAQDENAKDFQGYATQKEVAAIKPHLAELASLLGFNYESAADKARKKKQADSLAAAAAAPRSTGDPTLDCMAKFQQDWAKTHQAEMEAVQKSGDMNEMMRLNSAMSLEMPKKCAPANDQ